MVAEPERGDAGHERERIAAALIAVVGENGFEETALEMVLARAGVGREAFDRHFVDIQDCFDRVWEEVGDDFAAQLKQAFAGNEPWRDRLRATAYFCRRYFEADRQRTRFVIFGALQGGPLARARRDVLLRAGIDIVDAGRQELTDPDSMSRTIAEAVVGSIYELFVTELQREGEATSWAHATRELMYIAVLPYLGADAAAEELEMDPPAAE